MATEHEHSRWKPLFYRPFKISITNFPIWTNPRAKMGDRMARKQSQIDTDQNAGLHSKEQEAEASLNNDEGPKKIELPTNASSSDQSDGEVPDEARSSSQKDGVPEKKVSMLKNAWDKTGLSPGMLLMMFK